MIIAVGSKNEAKLRAVSKACNKISAMSTLSPWNSNDKVGIMGVNVESGVGDQPMSDSECIEGAITRAKNALEAIENATYGIGLEGGVHQIGNKWFESGWIAVVDRNGVTGLGSSARFELSAKIIFRLKDGEELATVMDDLSGQVDVRSNGGAMGILTNGILDRDEAYTHGVWFAFAPFLSNEKYWN